MSSLNLTLVFGVLVTFLSTIACNDDDLQPECEVLSPVADGWGRAYVEFIGQDYTMPEYNPVDPTEILLIKVDTTLVGNNSLLLYNREEQSIKEIFNGHIVSRPRWGKNGKIALNIKVNGDFGIYLIDSDGSNLQKISDWWNCHDPVWNVTGEMLMYYMGYLDHASYSAIQTDASGILIDSIRYYTDESGDWCKDSLLVKVLPDGLYVLYEDSTEYHQLYEVEFSPSAHPGAQWIDDETVFWTHLTGVYLTNIITKETTQVRATCNSYSYLYADYSPLIDKIICSRDIGENVSESKRSYIREIVMMDPDGSNEEVLVIPDLE